MISTEFNKKVNLPKILALYAIWPFAKSIYEADKCKIVDFNKDFAQNSFFSVAHSTKSCVQAPVPKLSLLAFSWKADRHNRANFDHAATCRPFEKYKTFSKLCFLCATLLELPYTIVRLIANIQLTAQTCLHHTVVYSVTLNRLLWVYLADERIPISKITFLTWCPLEKVVINLYPFHLVWIQHACSRCHTTNV